MRSFPRSRNVKKWQQVLTTCQRKWSFCEIKDLRVVQRWPSFPNSSSIFCGNIQWPLYFKFHAALCCPCGHAASSCFPSHLSLLQWIFVVCVMKNHSHPVSFVSTRYWLSASWAMRDDAYLWVQNLILEITSSVIRYIRESS